MLVSKVDANPICAMCIVEQQPDVKTLVVFKVYVKEKREELRKIFMKNAEFIRKLKKMSEETKNLTFN